MITDIARVAPHARVDARAQPSSLIEIPPVHIAPRSVIHTAQDWGKFYRLQAGMVRLDIPCADGLQLAGLLVPGDLLGAELLVANVYSFTATALVPCVLQPC